MMHRTEKKPIAPIIALFHKAEDYFSSALCIRSLHIDGIASAYCTNVHESPLNTFVIKGSASSLSDVLNKAKAFFAVTDTPWCVVMRADLMKKDHLSIFANFGFVPHELSVAMVLFMDERPVFAHNEPGFSIMDKRLSEWAVPLEAFPAGHGAVLSHYKKSHELALERKKNITHLSLFENDCIVSSCTLSWNEDWARIDDLATSPTLQRKGYATRMMASALELARKNHTKMCFLEASPKGLSLYQKMGFEALFENQVFLKK